MTLTFLKRERGLRMLPVTCAVALLFAAIFVPIAAELDFRSVDEIEDAAAVRWNTDLAYTFLILSAIQSVAITSLRFLPIAVRVRPFERGLPVTMRRVVLERTTALWVTLAVPFLVASLAWLVRLSTPTEFATYGVVVGRGLVAMGVGVLALACYRPSAPDLRAWEIAALVVVLLVTLLVPGSFGGPWLDAVYAGLLVALFALALKAIPDGSPAVDPRVTSPAAEVSATWSLVRWIGPLRWTMLRSTVLRPSILILSLFGALFVPFASDGNPFILMWFPVLIVTGALRLGLNALHGLDALPIRRRRLLRLAGLPTLGLLAAMFAATASSETRLRSSSPLAWGVEIDMHGEDTWGEEGERRLHIKVPPRLWRIASSADDARVTSPWGETLDPTLHPVVIGSDTYVVNPYDVSEESSGRFFAWQVARALEEVHGYGGDLDAVHASWFSGLDLDRSIDDAYIPQQSSADWGFTVESRSTVPNAAWFGAFVATLFWFLLVVYVLRPNVPNATDRPALRWLRSDAAGATAFIAFVFFAIAMQGNDDALIPVLVANANLALDGALGSSTALWAVLDLATAALAYVVAARRVERIEVPPLAVNGWTKRPMPVF